MLHKALAAGLLALALAMPAMAWDGVEPGQFRDLPKSMPAKPKPKHAPVTISNSQNVANKAPASSEAKASERSVRRKPVLKREPVKPRHVPRTKFSHPPNDRNLAGGRSGSNKKPPS